MKLAATQKERPRKNDQSYSSTREASDQVYYRPDIKDERRVGKQKKRGEDQRKNLSIQSDHNHHLEKNQSCGHKKE